jgi:transmembrane 9 superfamily protein 3
MYLDDLPFWGMVGEMLPSSSQLKKSEEDDLDRLEHVADITEAELTCKFYPYVYTNAELTRDTRDLSPYVYTTRNLIISYNKDRIVKVDLTCDPKSLTHVKEGRELEFKLLVTYQQTSEEFHSLFDRYLDHQFFKNPIHQSFVLNSFMMVLFLMAPVAFILLRTLKKDDARYGLVHDVEDNAEDQHFMEEKGHAQEDARWKRWKQVHGDVFRGPADLALFSALVGTGWQLVVLTLGGIVYAVLGPLHGAVHENYGGVLYAIITCYSLSSIVAGFASGKFYKLYSVTKTKGSNNMWQATMGFTVMLLPTVTVSILSTLNVVSLVYGTIYTIPFMVILKLFLLWIFVTVPLAVLGTLVGRLSPLVKFPCRVNAIPRPIPEHVRPWYCKSCILIPWAGLLSFGTIFIELYYIMTSLCNYKFFLVNGFLLGVYGILTIVVVCMTSIIVVYLLLNAENYHWQWTAFFSGASLGGYVFVYGIYYFLFKTQMNGFLQVVFYFGYMSLIAIYLGMMGGTLAHVVSTKFVRVIFQNVKVD